MPLDLLLSLVPPAGFETALQVKSLPAKIRFYQAFTHGGSLDKLDNLDGNGHLDSQRIATVAAASATSGNARRPWSAPLLVKGGRGSHGKRASS
jgi:hypothetical protein